MLTFYPIEIRDFSGAYTNVGEPRSLRPDEAQTFNNIVLFGKGSFGSRAGYKRIATQISTSEITGLMPLIKKDGTHELIISYDDKLVSWDESGDVWSAAIHTATTSGKQRDSVSYDDYVWIVNQGTGANDYYARYDGTTYTQYSANPKGNRIVLNKQRACVSGVAAALQNVYYSALDDLTDFTFSTPRVAGEGGIVSFPEFGDDVKTLITRDFGADLKSPTYVLKGSSVWTISWETVVLASGTQDDFPVRSLLKSNTGASSARSAHFENNIIFHANQNYKEIRTLGYEANFTDQRTNNLTRKIRNTAKYYNFDEAAAIWWENKFLLACKTASATFNDVVLVFDSFFPTSDAAYAVSVFDWHVNAWAIYKNELYFASSDSGEVFKAFQQNDDENSAISCLYSSGDLDFGLPAVGKQCKMVFIEGYMTDVAEINVKAYHDFNGSESWAVTLNGTGGYVSQNAGVSLGVSKLGSKTPLGGGAGGNQDTEYKPFFAHITTPRNDFFRQTLTIDSDTAGGAWIITNITYWVAARDEKWRPTAHQQP